MAQSQMSYEIIKRSVPFVDIKDFQQLIDKVKDRRIVMLGESTHGTKEFYEWRNLLTAELVRNHGFNIIAVEGDWPPCQAINRYIQGKTNDGIFKALSKFSRWPTWMWGNAEMVGFMDFLQEWNNTNAKKVGFFGLDVYSLYDSIEEVVKNLNSINPKLAKKVKKEYSCFDPYWKNERAYTRSIMNYSEGCASKVVDVFNEIYKYDMQEMDEWLDIAQNARVVKNAEKYYHAMISYDDESWNIRDRHMIETLDMLIDKYGPDSKAVIWEHNTHIGDYHATNMVAQGQVNLGGLAREKYGIDQVALVGFTTYKGTVLASHMWDGPIEVIDLPPAKSGSIESILHETIPQVGNPDYYLIFDNVEDGSPLKDFRGHRAIGVVYNSSPESRSHYIPSSIADRYDALIFLDETSALTPLYLNFDPKKVPETYPFGTRI